MRERRQRECDREGRSSVFRRKMRPRSGMHGPVTHKCGRRIPYADRSRFAGPLRPALRVATAKGRAVPSEGRCDPVAGMHAPSQSIIAVAASASAARSRFAGPSCNAFGRHCVTLLGVADQATTCVVRLVIIPILPATRSAKDLFRDSLLDAKILFPITPRRRQRRRMGRNISFLRYLCAWPGFLVFKDAYFLFLTSSNSASTTSPSTGFSLPAWDPGSAPGWAC